jgi:hypothetical protein
MAFEEIKKENILPFDDFEYGNHQLYSREHKGSPGILPHIAHACVTIKTCF